MALLSLAHQRTCNVFPLAIWKVVILPTNKYLSLHWHLLLLWRRHLKAIWKMAVGLFGRPDVPGVKEKERAGTQVTEGSQDEGRAVTQLGSLRTYRLNGEITWENAGEVDWKAPEARDGNLVLLAYSFLSQSWVKTSLESLPWGKKGSDGKERRVSMWANVRWEIQSNHVRAWETLRKTTSERESMTECVCERKRRRERIWVILTKQLRFLQEQQDTEANRLLSSGTRGCLGNMVYHGHHDEITTRVMQRPHTTRDDVVISSYKLIFWSQAL